MVPNLHKVISLELSWQTLGKKPKSKDQGKLFRISSARKMPRRVIAPPFVYCLDHNCLETAKKVLQNIVHQARVVSTKIVMLRERVGLNEYELVNSVVCASPPMAHSIRMIETPSTLS